MEKAHIKTYSDILSAILEAKAEIARWELILTNRETAAKELLENFLKEAAKSAGPSISEMMLTAAAGFAGNFARDDWMRELARLYPEETRTIVANPGARVHQLVLTGKINKVSRGVYRLPTP